jgi:hypothetical protein
MSRVLVYAFAIFLLMGLLEIQAATPSTQDLETLENLKNCLECEKEYKRFLGQLQRDYPNWNPNPVNWDGAALRSEGAAPTPPAVPSSGNTRSNSGNAQQSGATPTPAADKKEGAQGTASKPCPTCGKPKSAAPPSPAGAKAAEAKGGAAAAKSKKKRGLGSADPVWGLFSILLVLAPALRKR